MGSIPTNGETTNFNFRPGIRVAVIGAGVSGICAAAHLLKQGADTTVFERSGVSSGIWHFDPRIDVGSTSFPGRVASAGDYESSLPGQFVEQVSGEHGHSQSDIKPHPLQTDDADRLEVVFSPPGPCYSGLKNNVPTPLLRSSLGPWAPGTDEYVSHTNVEEYLQQISARNGVDEVTLYHTRVENVQKSANGQTWIVRTITLRDKDTKPRILEKTWEFDAVVVSSGHYNLPRVPNILGLKEWKESFRDRIFHSKAYRNAEAFRGKNVLVIGGGVSSLDVCREISEVSGKVYQSTRSGLFDIPESMLPPGVKRVGEVVEFDIGNDFSSERLLQPFEPIPGQVKFKDGSSLEQIHHVIIATGYTTSYPFLRQYHADDLLADDALPDTLVTGDGNMVHNLHKDIFYIPDPTLVFIGVPYYVATFSLFDFQAQAVARVLTGKTRLPTKESMRLEYDERVALRGRGRNFHSLIQNDGELTYVKELVDWVNKDTVGKGLDPMVGHPDQWLEEYRKFKDRRERFSKVAEASLPSPTTLKV